MPGIESITPSMGSIGGCEAKSGGLVLSKEAQEVNRVASSTFFDLGLETLHLDPLKIIFNLLPIDDLGRLRRVSKKIKERADWHFRSSKKQMAILDYIAEREQKGYVATCECEELFRNFLKDQPMQLIEMMESISQILSTTSSPIYKRSFSGYLDMFLKDHFKEEFFSTLPLPTKEKILEIVLSHRYEKAQAHLKLYLLFAPSSIRIEFVNQSIAKYWCRPFCNEESIKWLKEAFNLPKEKKKFYKLALQLLHLGLDLTKNMNAFSFVEKVLPELALIKLTAYLKEIARERRYVNRPYWNIPPRFCAWQVLKLCGVKEPIDLRFSLSVLYQEGIDVSPPPEKAGLFDLGWKGKKSWRKCFIAALCRGVLEMPRDLQEHVTKRLTYALNGMGKVDPKLQAAYVENLYVLQEARPDLLKVALKEWIHSHQDASFFTDFALPFPLIDSKELFSALIDEVLSLKEPFKSLYLQALANGVEGKKIHHIPLSHIDIRIVLQQHLLQMPFRPISRLELFLKTSASRGFIERCHLVKTSKDLSILIEETLNLPEEQKVSRLRVLLHGLTRFLVEAILPPLTWEARLKVFKSKGLDLERFPKIHFDEFLLEERRAFYRQFDQPS